MCVSSFSNLTMVALLTILITAFVFIACYTKSWGAIGGPGC